MNRNRANYSHTIPHFRSKFGFKTAEQKVNARPPREAPTTERERRRTRRENLISLNTMKKMVIMWIIIKTQNLITYRYKSI